MIQTVKAYVHLTKYSWNSEWQIMVSDHDFCRGEPMHTSKDGAYIALKTVELSVDLPDSKALATLEIDALQGAIAAEREASAQRIAIMQDKISKLTCLEHQPEEDA